MTLYIIMWKKKFSVYTHIHVHPHNVIHMYRYMIVSMHGHMYTTIHALTNYILVNRVSIILK